jgi:NAD-dependent deacetylase
VNYAPFDIPKFVVDKKIPYLSFAQNITGIEKGASEGMQVLLPILQQHR